MLYTWLYIGGWELLPTIFLFLIYLCNFCCASFRENYAFQIGPDTTTILYTMDSEIKARPVNYCIQQNTPLQFRFLEIILSCVLVFPV